MGDLGWAQRQEVAPHPVGPRVVLHQPAVHRGHVQREHLLLGGVDGLKARRQLGLEHARRRQEAAAGRQVRPFAGVAPGQRKVLMRTHTHTHTHTPPPPL